MASTIDVGDLGSRVGEALGASEWHTISQADVDTFARLTGDHQWIHVDPERAKTGPFGGTVVYGYLTLSLATVMLDEVLTVTGAGVVLNYGANRVRFPAPVPVGSRVRGQVTLAAADAVPGGVQASWQLTFEIEGAAKPGCVAEILFRYYTELPGGARPAPS